ncbi:transketolase-like [Trichosurus vulpecula]|uniref:transketolase-like n=1 Tax=Trichosurus vulpecula TaxID=9337 RepID=UPI00186B1369|nr:transketolase-like [Trichosurus vulpecula]
MIFYGSERHFFTLASWQRSTAVTPRNYSYHARFISKSSDNSLECCEITVTTTEDFGDQEKESPDNAVIYDNENFQIGQAMVVLKSRDDQATVTGAEVTFHEALASGEQLKRDKINIQVLDPFIIKPLDKKLFLDSARATHGSILTVEDHYYEGGIREAVAAAVVGEPGITITHLMVSNVLRSLQSC